MKKRPESSDEEKRIIIGRGTEPPFRNLYWNHFKKGLYRCRNCGAPLYRSDDKFDSGCGWPAFDDEIPGAVARRPDADGTRTEISCARCGGHLGHVFSGEGLTEKDTRHCVNSVSLLFEPAGKGTERAVFAGGCFWGLEYHFRKAPGVSSVASGYTGGRLEKPSYEQVCAGNTGHYEAVEVIFDPARTSYEELLRLFFQVHDFTQADGQGPDIGPQYRSAVFYASKRQQEAAERVTGELKTLGYRTATRILPLSAFWKAEDYHQDYYGRNGQRPYCHAFRRIF